MDSPTPADARRGSFPATRYSVVAAAGSADPEVRRQAFDALVAAYWKPVYKYVRVKWRAGAEDAQDLTQELFTRALEKRFFDRYDPRQAPFRSYLRTCVDGLAAKQRRAARRLKRGGGAATVSLDFDLAEGELAGRDAGRDTDPEEYFQREWVRSFFELALAALEERCREQGKEVCFALFRCYDLDAGEAGAGTRGAPGKQGAPAAAGERPTYAQLAAAYGLPVTQVTNYLAWVRRELRRIVLERLRALTGSEAEFRAEARLLLGVDPGGDPPP